MPVLASIDLPDLVAKRLEALAQARATAAPDLASRILADYVASSAARRDIRKHRRGAPLTDLGWLDGYEGESVDGILAFSDSENAYSLLAVLEAAIEKHLKQNPGKRTGVDTILLAVMALLREVNNGGFDQFYRNSSKRWAFFIPSALAHIDRSDAAKIAGRALRSLGRFQASGLVEKLRELDEKMSRPSTRRTQVLEACDAAFYNLTDLPESLLAYARRHPNAIVKD